MKHAIGLFAAAGILLAAGAAHAQDCAECGPERGGEYAPIDIGVGVDAAFYSPGGANDTFTGIGLNVRHHFDDRLAVEGTIGAFRAQDASAASPYAVRAYPAQVSLLGYVFPRSPIRFYGIAGATLEESTVSDTSVGRNFNFTRGGGHVGLGMEIVTGRITWQADTRYVIYGNNPPGATSDRPAAPFPGTDAHLVRLGATMYF